ncbi:hypothetical protein AgCh_039078 [Apium graveolens]
MRMLCDNMKSFRPLSHYSSARKARIDRIIFEKFHAPAINAASSELLEEKTNKSDAELQEWDITRSYVYILDRMSSFVNASNQHNDATPTYWGTRANPAELVNQNNQEHEEVEYNEFDLEDYNEEETMDTNEGEGQSGNPMDQIMNLLRDNLNCHPQPRLIMFQLLMSLRPLVYSKMEEEHAEYLRIVVEALRREKLFAKFSSIPMRKNNHTYGSRNFLGINRFYERLVQDFAKISGPLTRPTCKTEKVAWNEKCEDSFQELKRSLVTAPVLALPMDIQFILESEGGTSATEGTPTTLRNSDVKVGTNSHGFCEFAYNHSYHASIEMPPHEALYGRRCHSPLYWDEVGERKLLGASPSKCFLSKPSLNNPSTTFSSVQEGISFNPLRAMKSYNAQTGRGNKAPQIKNLLGSPKQPGGVECGYVIMRYMKDIIADKELSFTTKWAAKTRKSYTRQELDEVRMEVLEFIQDKM